MSEERGNSTTTQRPGRPMGGHRAIGRGGPMAMMKGARRATSRARWPSSSTTLARIRLPSLS